MLVIVHLSNKRLFSLVHKGKNTYSLIQKKNGDTFATVYRRMCHRFFFESDYIQNSAQVETALVEIALCGE